ncbi:conserved protein, unknown function, partial [Hepatocystis sp. ex Piliocolobus tephrosceles]
MKYAEYYTKQGVVTINAEVNVCFEPLINDLLISKSLLNNLKASVIINKKTIIQDFCLYKIKLNLIYNKNIDNKDNVRYSKKSINENSLSISSSVNPSSFYSTVNKQVSTKKDILFVKGYNLNSNINNNIIEKNNTYESFFFKNGNNVTVCKGNADMYKDVTDTCKNNNHVEKIKQKFNKSHNDKQVITDYVEYKKLNSINTLKKTQHSEKTNYYKTNNGVMHVKLISQLLTQNKKDNNNINNTLTDIKMLVKKNKELTLKQNYFDITSVLKCQNIVSNNLKNIFENDESFYCTYIFLPSFLTIVEGKIQSIIFTLKKKKLSILLLIHVIVNKKNTKFFDLNINKELNSMLNIKQNNYNIQCNSCNADMLILSPSNFIMPHLYLNIPTFFEHAFCEECSSFSFNDIKYNENNIYLFSSCLYFSFNLIKISKLVLKKDSIEHVRCLLFCEHCYNVVGYIEKDAHNSESNVRFGNNNNITLSYDDYKKMNEDKKNYLFCFKHEINKNDYIQFDRFSLLNLDKPVKEKNEQNDKKNNANNLICTYNVQSGINHKDDITTINEQGSCFNILNTKQNCKSFNKNEKKEDSNYAQNEKKEDSNNVKNEKKEDSNYAQNEK